MLHINIFASALSPSLAVIKQGTGDALDVIHAAVTSLEMERALAMVEEQKEVIPSVELPTYFHHKELLKECDALLKEEKSANLSATVHQALDEWFTVAVERLQAFAAHVQANDLQDGMDALLAIDGVVSLAVVACRHGWIEEKRLRALTTQASSEVWELAAELCNLWEYAENREQQFAPASDYPEAFAFWEELAQLSSSRLALQEAMTLRTTAERDIILKRVLTEIT